MASAKKKQAILRTMACLWCCHHLWTNLRRNTAGWL